METCQRCNEETDEIRSLWMSCLYAMDELKVPFKKRAVIVPTTETDCLEKDFFTLRVCKECRSDWMTSIEAWFKSQAKHKGCGSGIYVRVNGANREVSEDEFEKMYPGKIPVRFIQE